MDPATIGSATPVQAQDLDAWMAEQADTILLLEEEVNALADLYRAHRQPNDVGSLSA